jgi:hypothetical protein
MAAISTAPSQLIILGTSDDRASKRTVDGLAESTALGVWAA